MAKQESAVEICRRRSLQVRIHAMAKRWEYSKDEYDEALALAKADPDAWEALCGSDETKFGVASEEIAAKHRDKRLGPPQDYGSYPQPEQGKAWWNRESEPTTR